MTTGNAITATDIAKELASEFEGITRADIVRVIRHYTGTPLLMPLGALNTGTGKKRIYGPDAVARGAVLLRLNTLGIPIGVINEAYKHFDRRLRKDFDSVDLVEAAGKCIDPAIVMALPDLANGKAWRAQLVDLNSTLEWWKRDVLIIRVRKAR